MSSCSNKSPTQDGVSAEWNSMAGEWDDLAKGYRDSFEKIVYDNTNIFDLNKNATSDSPLIIVDFGCGTGLLTESLRRKLNNDTTKIVCLDAASEMIKVLQDKIRAGEWNNVIAHTVALASMNEEFETTVLQPLYGTVDIIVASSVLVFIPENDIERTMNVLGKLLKPNGKGLLVHSDWPKDNNLNQSNGFTEERAKLVHGYANLTTTTSKIVEIQMGPTSDNKGNIFLGIAQTK